MVLDVIKLGLFFNMLYFKILFLKIPYFYKKKSLQPSTKNPNETLASTLELSLSATIRKALPLWINERFLSPNSRYSIFSLSLSLNLLCDTLKPFSFDGLHCFRRIIAVLSSDSACLLHLRIILQNCYLFCIFLFRSENDLMF